MNVPLTSKSFGRITIQTLGDAPYRSHYSRIFRDSLPFTRYIIQEFIAANNIRQIKKYLSRSNIQSCPIFLTNELYVHPIEYFVTQAVLF
jgi:hypothetical protein